ncbi:MAG: PepSY domain-containing protein [Tissierellia bacterium]|nr:PepSY domain-containing protein [Tissierellia bacterium]
MNEKQILSSLKKSINQAPIDILEKIKEEPRTKMLQHDHITMQNTRTNSFRKVMPYASVAAALFIGFFGWYFQRGMPDSKVYLDVNPSIEIVTNRQDEVIDLTAYNTDGTTVTKDLEYKGKTMYQVTEDVLDRMLDEGYIDKEHEFLLLSVYNKNDSKAEQQKQNLDKSIHQYLQAKELEPIILSQKLSNTSTIERYAKEYGISVSKMTFIRNLIILNPDLQTEDLVDLGIEELVSLSQGMGIELDKIIDSSDFDKIKNLQTEPIIEPEYEPEPELISLEQARTIALSVADGVITDLDFDDDDLEYEVEIQVGDLEYEITIDARTGEIIEIEIDD